MSIHVIYIFYSNNWKYSSNFIFCMKILLDNNGINNEVDIVYINLV